MKQAKLLKLVGHTLFLFILGGCKWSLLKVRKEKYKGEHGGTQLGKKNTKGSMVGPKWKAEAERGCVCSSGDFETLGHTLNY
jgi:hypothetical protein